MQSRLERGDLADAGNRGIFPLCSNLVTGVVVTRLLFMCPNCSSKYISVYGLIGSLHVDLRIHLMALKLCLFASFVLVITCAVRTLLWTASVFTLANATVRAAQLLLN